MNTKITGKNIEVTSAMKDYIEKRLERLEKFSSSHTEVNVVCSVEREEQIIEIQVSTGKDFLRVEEKTRVCLKREFISFMPSVNDRELVVMLSGSSKSSHCSSHSGLSASPVNFLR